MDKNYKLLVEEQREKLRAESAFYNPTEDITLILNENERKKWGEAPLLIRPSHPRVMITEDTIPGSKMLMDVICGRFLRACNNQHLTIRCVMAIFHTRRFCYGICIKLSRYSLVNFQFI